MAAVTTFLKKKGYPKDDRFIENFVSYDLAPSNYSKSILVALERSHEHKEAADLGQVQVEHIMPQTLSDAWKKSLGDEAEQVHAKWLHTPGNLTLSAYNAEMSNNPFEIKKDEYQRSNVVLSRKISNFEKWGKKQIEERSRALAQQAAKVWPGPPVE